VIVRRALPFLIAAVLGPASAFLASCGDRSALIPGSNADRIKGDLDKVQSAIFDQNCDLAARYAQKVASDVQALPSTVDQRLQGRLADGAQNLVNQAQPQCQKGVATQTNTTTETTPTETTPTQTTPTQTTTTPTTTTPPPTVPTVPTGPQGAVPPPIVDTGTSGPTQTEGTG
jgi:hypothetical protein